MHRTGIRKTIDTVHKRADIAFAAAQTFQRKGFRATTMQEIARASGYTAASLYTYFKSKDEIAQALFDLLKAEILAAFEMKAPSGSTFAQRLEMLVWSQLTLAEKRKEAFGLLMSGDLHVVCHEDRDEFAEGASRWMKENAAAKDLGRHDAGTAAAVLGGIQFAFLKEWMRKGFKSRLAVRAPEIVDLFLHGVSPR